MIMLDRIDRSSIAPAHIQVLDRLRELVLDLPWDQSPVIPGEPALMERFGVSRGTLRRATSELVREGLLVAERGRGTFVSRPHQVRLRMREVVEHIALPDSRWHTDVTRFVPDFKGSGEAVEALARSDEYLRSGTIFVTPDNSVRGLIASALGHGRRVLVPTYGLRRGIVCLDGPAIDPTQREFASTLDGLERFGRALKLDELASTRIDLIVTGAVAVSRDGRHFGSAAAYFEIEWGILRALGAVDHDTPVVCVCHDSQVVELRHDWEDGSVSVDLIVTPTAVVRAKGPLHRPAGVNWDAVTTEQLTTLAYLNSLQDRAAAKEYPGG